MADTKLTREWVEEELISAEKYGLHRQAALCRHYLATEQEARDAALGRRIRWDNGFGRSFDGTIRSVTHHIAKPSRYGIQLDDGAYCELDKGEFINIDAAIDAAITQKETPK